MSTPHRNTRMQMRGWITSRSRRDIVSFVGGAVVMVVGAAWTLYTHFEPADPASEVTCNVCFAPSASKRFCSSGTLWVQGYAQGAKVWDLPPSAISDWVKTECAKYSNHTTFVRDGPMKECNCVVVTVKCSSG